MEGWQYPRKWSRCRNRRYVSDSLFVTLRYFQREDFRKQKRHSQWILPPFGSRVCEIARRLQKGECGCSCQRKENLTQYSFFVIVFFILQFCLFLCLWKCRRGRNNDKAKGILIIRYDAFTHSFVLEVYRCVAMGILRASLWIQKAWPTYNQPYRFRFRV